jgi:hypothetical protein
VTPAVKRGFLLPGAPEVFLSTAETSRAVGDAVAAGEARKLGPRLYTRNTVDPPKAVARRNWQTIAAMYFPGAVVVDRSAFEAKPTPDGSIFLDAGPSYSSKRAIALPGLALRPRSGPGPVRSDKPFMGGLHFSGPARKFLDNMRPSRSRSTNAPRTLSRTELEEELVRMTSQRGSASLNELREEAREIAPELSAEQELDVLEDLIGSVLGTRDSDLETAAARAQQSGSGFDPARIELFQALQSRLLRETLPRRAEKEGSWPTLSFFEAYFSNWIEGTEFELDEAEAIVFEGEVPEGRSEDAHDVLGTFQLVNEPARRVELPADPDQLLELLRSHHALMLARRDAARPGRFKDRPNRAGRTTFVHPDLVNGTLQEGFGFHQGLEAGLPRAIFMMFLIGETHPFTDGNGRLARVLMNADLSAAGLQRIVIPLSYRDNYLQSLRAMSNNGDPGPLIRVLDYAQKYAAAIDWRNMRAAEQGLRETNAFVTPDEAEASGRRLRLPAGAPD